MVDLMGCEHWALEVIGDIALLDARTAQLRNEQIMETIADCEHRLKRGIEALEAKKACHQPRCTSFSESDTQRRQLRTYYVTLAFATTAKLLLSLAKSDASSSRHRVCEDVHTLVDHIIAILTQAAEMMSLRSEAIRVPTDDGVLLHAEIDEIAPYEGKLSKKLNGSPQLTLVFIHGYALNLDCWYFQRDAFRGKHRMAFYDQRSHGRSDRSPRAEATIDQLGDDVADVLTHLVPEGDVILIGHSMGGMSIMAFAERHPTMFRERVRGTALLATTAGDLRPHRIFSRLIPDGLGDVAA
ncbi:MAG: alpha/beta fold hydrolase, partial [Oxalobacteraceae bacterium]